MSDLLRLVLIEDLEIHLREIGNVTAGLVQNLYIHLYERHRRPKDGHFVFLGRRRLLGQQPGGE